MGGKKFKFDSLDPSIQAQIKNRLAEKDPIMAQGSSGKLVGIKIDGEVVTQELVNKIDKSKGAFIIPVPTIPTPTITASGTPIKFTKEELIGRAKAIGAKAFEAWAKGKYGTTEKTTSKIINAILKKQG